MLDYGTPIFPTDKVQVIVDQSIQAVLVNQTYDAEKIGAWQDQICSRILAGLLGMNLEWNYVVNCTIVEKVDRDTELSTACVTSQETGVYSNFQWENANILCDIFFCAIYRGKTVFKCYRQSIPCQDAYEKYWKSQCPPPPP